MHLTIGHTIELEIIETMKSCAYGDANVLDTAYVAHIKYNVSNAIVWCNSFIIAMHDNITIRFAQ